MCSWESWWAPWLPESRCMVKRTMRRGKSITSLIGIFSPDICVSGKQWRSMSSCVVISPPRGIVNEIGSPRLDNYVRKYMYCTSTVRMWSHTLKYCCSGFHILSIYSNNLTWDLMLRSWKIFRRPQPHRADIETTSAPSLTSSASCFLSFQKTIFSKATFQKSNLNY